MFSFQDTNFPFGKWWAKVDSMFYGLYFASLRVIVQTEFLCPFSLSGNGGPKWTRTIDLTIISRVL